MKLGMIMTPIHAAGRDTHAGLLQDVEMAVQADALGYDEFWIAEHYSALRTPVNCPFTFLANLIARTKRMKLGTGVVNLPYHHPAVIAAHAALLDHLSEGRLLLGVGPGGLPSDFELFGVTDSERRAGLARETIDTILALWSQDGPYEFTGQYRDVGLREFVFPELGVGTVLKPYQTPHPPIACPAASPYSGTVRDAGRRGWSPISANFIPAYSVRSHWQVYAEGCAEVGRAPDPDNWRVTRTIFVGADAAAAADYLLDPEGIFHDFFDYVVRLFAKAKMTSLMKSDPDMPDEAVTPERVLRECAIAGDTHSVVEQILAYREEVGPFGVLLFWTVDAPRREDWEALLASSARLAGEVMPRVRERLGAPAR